MTERRKENSERIVQAAFDLVSEVGVSGLRTRDIAERAGVNIATLHYCFEGKEAILEALYLFIKDQFREEFDRQLADSPSPAETIRRHTELRAKIYREQSKPLRVWRAFIGEAWIYPAIHQILQRRNSEQKARFAKIIADGIKAGQFLPLWFTDEETAASLLIALYDGMYQQIALDPDHFDSGRYISAIYQWLGMSETHSRRDNEDPE